MHPLYPGPLVFLLSATIFLFMQCILTPANAQLPTTGSPPTVNIQPYARGRIFSASTTSPIASTLSRLPQVVEATATLTNYFDAVVITVDHALAVSRGEQPRQNNTIPVCNNRSIPWRSATANFAQHRGWPVDRKRRCVTDVYGIPKASHLTDTRLGDVAVRRARGVHSATKDIIAAAGLNNWTYSETDLRYAFNRGSQKCNIDSVSGVRVSGLWYTPVGITNRPSREWLPSGDRQYLTEYVRVDEDQMVSALMTLPVNPVEGTVHNVETRSTTVLAKWAGSNQPSQFLPMAIEENVALQDALDKGQHYLQQVEDATTGSNVAILALPLVLSLVPIGLVADVTRKRMLVYVLLTDVLTGLPMWIKGVELVQISKKRFTSTVTRVGDVSVEENMTVVMEVWVASCGSQENVRAIGVTFIAVATLLMVFGVGLEIVVRIRNRGKQTLGQYEAVMEEFDGEEQWGTCNGAACVMAQDTRMHCGKRIEMDGPMEFNGI